MTTTGIVLNMACAIALIILLAAAGTPPWSSTLILAVFASKLLLSGVQS